MTLLQFKHLAAFDRLIHAVTTNRPPDEDSRGPFNLADHVGTGRERAVEARKRLTKHLGLSFERLTIPQQVQAGRIAVVDRQQAGRGRGGRRDSLPDVDGVVTALTALPMMILSADCPLIIAYDPQASVLGLAHAGWRSTAAAIARNLVQTMCRDFSAEPQRILAGIAPAARSCCYQVGSDVIAALTPGDLSDRCVERRNGRTFLDLTEVNRTQLLKCGLQDENIRIMDPCTICDDRFFSHRRDGVHAGRFGLIAAMVAGQMK